MNADDYALMSNELSRWDDCAESDIERLQIVAKQLNDEISMLNAELARVKALSEERRAMLELCREYLKHRGGMCVCGCDERDGDCNLDRLCKDDQ